MIPWPNKETLAQLDSVLQATPGARIGAKVGVLGLGVVGRAMAAHLCRRGATVIAADVRAELGKEPFAEALRARGAELRLGPTGSSTFDDVAALAISPGADPEQPAVRAALERGVPVFAELELCGALPAARVAAITGTNGKSTTTALLGALVEGTGAAAFVGGNLGDPVIAWVDRDEPRDVAVLELSSFQLETAFRFTADVGIVLNVTPDHGDRYPDIEAYARTKERLVEAIPEDGVAVLSHDDPRVRAMGERRRGRVWWWSTLSEAVSGGAPSGGAASVGGGACAVLAGDGHHVHATGDAAVLDGIDLEHPRMVGRHNRENALAALLAACALGRADDREALLAAYRSFTGLPHRLEWVADVGGVAYVNDSKATNDESAATGVRAMERTVVLLLGGRDKGGGYEQVLAAARGKVRQVITFGEAKDLITAAFAPSFPVHRCAGLAEALDAARERARPGEVVLLSPACSSFDQFTNYIARGDTFRRTVRGWGNDE